MEIEKAIYRLRELGVDTETLFDDYNKIPLETINLSNYENEIINTKKVTKHNIIIDSRSRNYQLYPSSSNYTIDLMEPHRNVQRIELVAAMLPKTEYNVNSENNMILLTVLGVSESLYLTEGQYLIGTNVLGQSYLCNGDPVVNGLLAELKNVLNTHSLSGGNFNVFLATTPQTGNNASVLNRIVISHTTNNFSIDFTNGNYLSGSPYRLLGFNKTIIQSSVSGQIYGNSNLGHCTPIMLQNGTTWNMSIPSIISTFDYDLIDDPMYIIMNLEFGNKSADRVESVDISSNQKFAVIIYDSNDPDNIETYPLDSNHIQLGVSRRPGRLKALKGADFDKKVLDFSVPITLENFKVSFLKYDNSYYNFHNREHTLTFEIEVVDFDPKINH